MTKDAPLRSIPQLLGDRASLVARIRAIDDELERRGVRAISKPIGRPSDVKSLVLIALAQGQRTTTGVATDTGQTQHATAQMLSKMALAGEIQRVGRSTYALR